MRNKHFDPEAFSKKYEKELKILDSELATIFDVPSEHLIDMFFDNNKEKRILGGRLDKWDLIQSYLFNYGYKSRKY
jgi:hypothetical protein